MSRHSLGKSKNRYNQSSEQQSLPQQWGSVQKRLEYLQTAMAKVQKKTQKNQKRLQNNQEELGSLRKELTKKIDQVNHTQGNDLEHRERYNQLDNLKEEIEELHSMIKKVQKKTNQTLKDIKSGALKVNYGQVQDNIQEKITEKLEQHYQITKAYIDRAVSELKLLVKQYAYVQPEPNSPRRTTNDLSRSISKSRISTHQKSSQRLIKTSQLRQDPQDTSFEEKSKLLSPKNQGSTANNGSSRVSYLREKLKEFEQINKKYEDKAQKTDRKGVREVEERRSIQKMKQFKNYLEQSESEIDQSNLDIKENEVLTDSIQRWRNIKKYNID